MMVRAKRDKILYLGMVYIALKIVYKRSEAKELDENVFFSIMIVEKVPERFTAHAKSCSDFSIPLLQCTLNSVSVSVYRNSHCTLNSVSISVYRDLEMPATFGIDFSIPKFKMYDKL